MKHSLNQAQTKENTNSLTLLSGVAGLYKQMKQRIILLLWTFMIVLNASAQQTTLSRHDRELLAKSLKEEDVQYDPNAKMLTTELKGWNYHTDAASGDYHDARASLYYAIKLLDYGGKRNAQRAFGVIDSVIALQDTNSHSGARGVWPYFKEEPLATKKSPVDFNWADFNAVSLIDIWIEHYNILPGALKQKMKNAILLAAQCIQRRNVGPSYTNIAIMGTHVTYVAAQLFDQREMLQYARNRLKRFYDYSIKRGGFDEYNSPTYTIVALDELNRMQRQIKDPGALVMIDSLYAMEWSMIARHYHKPTGQWVGPHSRAYSPLVDLNFSGILFQASGGKAGVPLKSFSGDVKIKHKIPVYLLHYFTDPIYPRTEKDIFVTDSPQVKGTAYMTSKYALSTANRSSMWNQRHPFLIYWGNVRHPQYCQLRFLHDFYDFSSASFYSAQKENKVLAGVNFITNGGDKHISIDRIKNGKFKAGDLRLRFEFDAATPISNLHLPESVLEPFSFVAGGLSFYIQPYELEFGDLKGRWETGRDSTKAWIDFVIYSGAPRDFDLTKINTAVLGFAMTIDGSGRNTQQSTVILKKEIDSLNVHWRGLQLRLATKPTTQPPNL